MKKLLSLVSFLIITSLLLCGYGAYLKYQVLAPLNLYQDKNIVELPFLMHTDAELKFMMQMQKSHPLLPLLQHQRQNQTEPFMQNLKKPERFTSPKTVVLNYTVSVWPAQMPISI